MNTIKMKIVGFEQNSGSVLVAFASDETISPDPADYQAVAIQIDSADDIETIKRKLAATGLQTVYAQVRKEKTVVNHDRLGEIVALIGQEISYPVSDFEAPAEDYRNEVQL